MLGKERASHARRPPRVTSTPPQSLQATPVRPQPVPPTHAPERAAPRRRCRRASSPDPQVHRRAPRSDRPRRPCGHARCEPRKGTPVAQSDRAARAHRTRSSHAPPWLRATGAISATSRCAASARLRHQPSARDPIHVVAVHEYRRREHASPANRQWPLSAPESHPIPPGRKPGRQGLTPLGHDGEGLRRPARRGVRRKLRKGRVQREQRAPDYDDNQNGTMTCKVARWHGGTEARRHGGTGSCPPNAPPANPAWEAGSPSQRPLFNRLATPSMTFFHSSRVTSANEASPTKPLQRTTSGSGSRSPGPTESGWGLFPVHVRYLQ